MKEETTYKRNSNIELVKIIAMFLIVINHVTRSIQPSQFYADSGYAIALSTSPQSIQEFILDIFCYFGPLGNSIFLICSIWFLLESNRVKLEKVKRLIIDTWVISVIFCVAFLIVGHTNMPGVYVVKSIFPIICCNNWYITCYLLLYLLHPLLNMLIERVERKSLLGISIGLFIAYFCIAFLSENLLYYSNLIFFIASYFIVGCIKKYSRNYLTSTKFNILVIVVSASVCVLLLIFTWVGSKYLPFLNNRMLMWTSNNNPFTFFIAFSIFNLVRDKKRCNQGINYISSLTLLIYIIHENIYVKSALRPYIWDVMYSTFGYSHLILLDLLYSFAFFCVACIIAYIYRQFNKAVSYRLLCPIFDGFLASVNRLIDIL